MQTVDNLYGIDYLYPKILILELIEKTKSCAVVWEKITPTAYTTHWSSPQNRYYDVCITYLRSNYRVDFVRNGRSVLNVDSGNVPEVVDLFRIIGVYLGQDDISTITPAIQNQIDCSRMRREKARGGVIVSGRGTVMSSTSVFGEDGVILGGSALFSKFLPGQGGILAGGSGVDSWASLLNGSGGAKTGGRIRIHPIAHDPFYAGLFVNNGLDIQVKLIDNGNETSVYDETFTTGNNSTIHDVCVDSSEGKIFWLLESDIVCSDLDGSNFTEILVGSFVLTFSIDPYNRKLYYIASGQNIYRCDYDGSNTELFFESTDDYDSPTFVMADADAGYVFWTQYAVQGSPNHVTVHRSDLDGSGETTIVDIHPYFSLYVDGLSTKFALYDSQIYLYNELRNEGVVRVDYDGSGLTNLVVTYDFIMSLVVNDTGMYFAYYGQGNGDYGVKKCGLDGLNSSLLFSQSDSVITTICFTTNGAIPVVSRGGAIAGGTALEEVVSQDIIYGSGGVETGGEALCQSLTMTQFQQFDQLGYQCRIATHPTLDSIYVSSTADRLNVYSKSGVLKQSVSFDSGLTPHAMIVADSGQKLFITMNAGSLTGSSTGNGLWVVDLEVDGSLPGDIDTSPATNITQLSDSLGGVGFYGLTASSSKVYVNQASQPSGSVTCKILSWNFDGSNFTTEYTLTTPTMSANTAYGYYANMCYRPTGSGPIWGDGRMYKSGATWYNLIGDHFARNSLTTETDVPITVPSPYIKLYNSTNTGCLTYDETNDVFYFPGYLNTNSAELHILQYNPNTAVVTEIAMLDVAIINSSISQIVYDSDTNKLFLSANNKVYLYQM